MGRILNILLGVLMGVVGLNYLLGFMEFAIPYTIMAPLVLLICSGIVFWDATNQKKKTQLREYGGLGLGIILFATGAVLGFIFLGPFTIEATVFLMTELAAGIVLLGAATITIYFSLKSKRRRMAYA